MLVVLFATGMALGCRRPDPDDSAFVNRDNKEIRTDVAPSDESDAEQASAERVWQSLGLKLDVASDQTVRQINSKYRGGMLIIEVLSGSPAEREGILAGDILVGLHKWETVSIVNLAYILDSDEFARAQPAKFFILRGTETLFGQICISQRDR